MGFHMGLMVPFLVGIRASGRTFVTKANCTPESHFERCGNPFISNESSYRGTYHRFAARGRFRAELLFCTLLRVTIPGINFSLHTLLPVRALC